MMDGIFPQALVKAFVALMRLISAISVDRRRHIAAALGLSAFQSAVGTLECVVCGICVKIQVCAWCTLTASLDQYLTSKGDCENMNGVRDGTAAGLNSMRS